MRVSRGKTAENRLPLLQAASRPFRQRREEATELPENSLEDTIPVPQRRRLAIAPTAAEIGAIAVPRAVAKTDPALSDEVLQAVREAVGAAHEVE